jgi:GNAT superfamily N-acetyltransferase
LNDRCGQLVSAAATFLELPRIVLPRCVEIRQFWVEEQRRKQGLGTKLLQAAEQEARRRSCRQMLLMTFSFQAPALYEEHGFEVVAVVDDHPDGLKNLVLRKRLGVAN